MRTKGREHFRQSGADHWLLLLLLSRGRLARELARHVKLVALQEREALQVLLPELELQLSDTVGGISERGLREVGLRRMGAVGQQRWRQISSHNGGEREREGR